MLHDYQHVEDSESGGHRDAEVARDDHPSVILKKSRPPLVAPRATGRRDWQLRHVLPNCARRNTQTEFQQQFVGDPLLTPRWVVTRHLANQLPEFSRDRPPASFGLPAPEEAEALAVPGDQGPGPHHNQSVSPIEPAAQQHQSETRRIVGSAGLDLALLIERELLAQEQILGRQRGSGVQAETQKVDYITKDPEPTQPCAHDPTTLSQSMDISIKSLRTMWISSQSEMFLRSTAEPAGSGAAVWHRPANGGEDAGVLGAAGIPAESAAGAAEAGSVPRDH